MQVQVLPDAPLQSFGISSTYALSERCSQKPEKRAWPILGQFLGRRSALWSAAPIEAEKKLRDLVIQAVTKGASGGRVTNGELVTVKSVRADGGIELSDGRALDSSFREFLPGYAVTSYGSQGKTVDYVLFSDSTIKAATNAQQWYVTISRGRRGIRIFTPDKRQLRENVMRSGHRPLAMEFTSAFAPRRAVRLWDRLHGYLLRFGRRAADNYVRLKLARRRHHQPTQKHEHKITRMLGE